MMGRVTSGLIEKDVRNVYNVDAGFQIFLITGGTLCKQ